MRTRTIDEFIEMVYHMTSYSHLTIRLGRSFTRKADTISVTTPEDKRTPTLAITETIVIDDDGEPMPDWWMLKVIADEKVCKIGIADRISTMHRAALSGE